MPLDISQNSENWRSNFLINLHFMFLICAIFLESTNNRLVGWNISDDRTENLSKNENLSSNKKNDFSDYVFQKPTLFHIPETDSEEMR